MYEERRKESDGIRRSLFCWRVGVRTQRRAGGRRTNGLPDEDWGKSLLVAAHRRRKFFLLVNFQLPLPLCLNDWTNWQARDLIESGRSTASFALDWAAHHSSAQRFVRIRRPNFQRAPSPSRSCKLGSKGIPTVCKSAYSHLNLRITFFNTELHIRKLPCSCLVFRKCS